MTNVNSWLSSGRYPKPDATVRAVAAWRRINDKSTSITIRRQQATLGAQTVRIEFDNGALEQMGVNTTPSLQRLTVFGVRGHPTVTNTDIRAKDMFVIGGKQYEVIAVIETLGEVQAQAEARS